MGTDETEGNVFANPFRKLHQSLNAKRGVDIGLTSSDKITFPPTASTGPQLVEGGRRTGKTQRLLDWANAKAQDGHDVLVLVPDYTAQADLRQRGLDSRVRTIAATQGDRHLYKLRGLVGADTVLAIDDVDRVAHKTGADIVRTQQDDGTVTMTVNGMYPVQFATVSTQQPKTHLGAQAHIAAAALPDVKTTRGGITFPTPAPQESAPNFRQRLRENTPPCAVCLQRGRQCGACRDTEDQLLDVFAAWLEDAEVFDCKSIIGRMRKEYDG